MRKSDIGLIGVIGLMVIAAVYLVGIEYQNEQMKWELMSEEDKAMTLLAENLRKTDKTNCLELSQVLKINTNQIMIDAITDKQKELGC